MGKAFKFKKVIKLGEDEFECPDNFYKLDEAIYKVIFIGLASLTFPHILLEYLLEKNEKRT